MANNQSIQILRGVGHNQSEVLLDGQPYYDKSGNKLYIGQQSKPVSQLTPIGREENIPEYSYAHQDGFFITSSDDLVTVTGDDVGTTGNSGASETVIGDTSIITIDCTTRQHFVSSPITITLKNCKMKTIWFVTASPVKEGEGYSPYIYTNYNNPVLDYGKSVSFNAQYYDGGGTAPGTFYGYNILLIGSTY